MAPLIIDDKVIIGSSGAEYGIRGFVRAYNAATGALVWNFYTIPAPNARADEGGINGWYGHWSPTTPEGTPLHRNIAKEKADSAKYADAWKTGGGSMWMTPAYDPDTQDDVHLASAMHRPISTARFARATTCGSNRSSLSMRRPASSNGVTRWCRTMCGTWMRPAHR